MSPQFGPKGNIKQSFHSLLGTKQILAKDVKFWGKDFPPGQTSGFVHPWAINEHELRSEGEGFMYFLYLEWNPGCGHAPLIYC